MSQRKARETRRAIPQTGPKRRAPKRGASNPRRKQIWIAVAAAAVVVVVIGGALIARDTGPAQAVVTRSGSTISFSGEDPITGKQVALSDFAGKPVVINVWGSWCEGCRAEAIALREFAAAHPEVQVLGVDLQDSKGGARGFYEEFAWKHPSVFDPDGSISFSLGLQGTPSTFFLNGQHRMVTRIVGETDRAGFEGGLSAALSES